MAKKIKLGLNIFSDGGQKNEIKKTISKLPKQEIITLDTHDSEYSTTPKIRDAEVDPETGESKSYYDPETGTIYLSPEDLSNNDVIKNFEKQHYGLIEQREKEKKITDRIAASKQKSFIPSSPISDDFTLDFTKDSKVNDDQTKDITGINTSVDYNKDGFNIGADASFKNDAARNKILFNLNNQRVGFESGIGDYTFGVKADNTFDENSKAAFNPNTSAFIQKNNFKLEGNNSFQKDENGNYSFNPNLNLSYEDENKSFSARHEFTKGEDGKWKVTPTLSGNIKSGNWRVGQTVSSNRDDENNNSSDVNSSVEYISPNERFKAGFDADYSRFNNEAPIFNNGTLNMSYRQPINRNLNLNISGSNKFERENLVNPELNLGINYGGRNNPVSFNIGNTFKQGSLFNPSVGFRYNLENGGTMNEELMQQVQQMIQQGASKGDVAQQLMAAVQEGQLDQESVMQVFQQLGITEQDLQQAQQPQEPTEAQQQVMALGGMRRYPDGGQPSPEEMAMMQQQQAQQQGAPQEGQPQGGGDQMQQVMQQVQQMIEQGAQPIDVVQALMQNQIPPEAIMQILTEMGMPPQEAQGLIQEVMQGGEQQPQGPGEEQMEGAASNPQEEAQEMPMQNYGGYIKEVMRKALGGNVTSDVDSGNVAAKRNLEFASVLKRNTHMSMLDNAFGNGVEDKQNNLPRADWGDELKALMEKYKDDPNAKAYMDATQTLREDDKYLSDLKTLREQHKDNPELLKSLDEAEKQYKAARQMQALQQQFRGAQGNGQYYQGPGQYYNNPSAFSRMINNSGWTANRPRLDISGIPLSNDPNAKYYITNKTDKQGMFGRRKVSFDVDWNRGDAAGTDPNKKVIVDPNNPTKTITVDTKTNKVVANKSNDPFLSTQADVDPGTIYDNVKKLDDAYQQNTGWFGKVFTKSPLEKAQRKFKNEFDDAVYDPNNTDAYDQSKALAQQFYGDDETKINEIDVENQAEYADAQNKRYKKALRREDAAYFMDDKNFENLPEFEKEPEEPLTERQQKRADRRLARSTKNSFEDDLENKVDVTGKNLTEAEKLKTNYDKANDLINNNSKYKGQVNPYSSVETDPKKILGEDPSRGDIKDYYREAFPDLSRRDVRRLARESDKSGKVLNSGKDFRSDYTFRINKAAETEQKVYGGNMWMPKADGGLQMYLKSLGLDKGSDDASGKGKVELKERFKLDWDAATDTTKDAMDWVSSKFDNLDVQERMDNPDRFSSVNQFAPQNYEQMSRGLYGQQGEFIPNDQGPTTIFNPTDAEGTFYRQLYALGGNVTLDSFTEEELQILKDAGYNIDDLI